MTNPKTAVNVIISEVVSYPGGVGWIAYQRLAEQTCPTLEEANTLGGTLMGEGKSVVIRPTYNEVDEEGKNFFREWRSFNGEAFKECRWHF